MILWDNPGSEDLLRFGRGHLLAQVGPHMRGCHPGSATSGFQRVGAKVAHRHSGDLAGIECAALADSQVLADRGVRQPLSPQTSCVVDCLRRQGDTSESCLWPCGRLSQLRYGAGSSPAPAVPSRSYMAWFLHGSGRAVHSIGRRRDGTREGDVSARLPRRV